MKKAKTSHGALDVYQTLSLPSKTVAARKIVITVLREVVVLADANAAIPTDVVPDTIFKNMDDLLARNQASIEAYHAEFLGVEPPKKQDKEQTAFWLWAWWCKNGKPILPNTDANGEKVRQSSIGSSQYFFGTNRDVAQIHTPQAKVCMDLFTRCIGDKESCTEADLRAFVEAHAAELKTKQDPWRIFQYYRPALIKTMHLRRV